MLPFSQVVNVNITANTNNPTIRTFAIGIILTATSVAGEVDAANLTKSYATLSEVAADFAAGTPVYEQANAIFAQEVTPHTVKVGFVNVTAGVSTAADLKAALDTLAASDNGFFGVLIDSPLRDDAMLDGLFEWAEANGKVALVDSNDADMTDDTDVANVAARNKGSIENGSVFYSSTASEYPAAATWAYMATRNFDDANTAYTLAFKKRKLLTVENLPSDSVAAITGFVPQVGQSVAAGHCANVYVDIGGSQMILYGSTLTPNVFLDFVHARAYLAARCEEQVLALLARVARIPFDNRGMQQLASAVRDVLARAQRTGLIAEDVDDNGEILPAFTIEVPDVATVTESQRAARISPAITARFRYAGAVHYATVNIQIEF